MVNILSDAEEHAQTMALAIKGSGQFPGDPVGLAPIVIFGGRDGLVERHMQVVVNVLPNDANQAKSQLRRLCKRPAF